MAKRIRRTTIEILQDDLQNTTDRIMKLEEDIATLKQHKAELEDKITSLKTQELVDLMNEKNVDIDTLRNLITAHTEVAVTEE